jgi:hypothetical protein
MSCVTLATRENCFGQGKSEACQHSDVMIPSRCVSPNDRAWVTAHHRGHALLHRVDPRLGLMDADYATLTDWLHRAHTAAWSQAAV